MTSRFEQGSATAPEGDAAHRDENSAKSGDQVPVRVWRSDRTPEERALLVPEDRC